MKTNDLEAIIFCGEVYVFTETQTAWVLSRYAGAVSIIYLKLSPDENREAFKVRLRGYEREIEGRFCMSCTSLCQTTDSVCWLYSKNKVESEDSDG